MDAVDIILKVPGSEPLTLRFSAAASPEITRERLAVVSWAVALANGRGATKQKKGVKALTDIVQHVTEVTS